ncbi:hypothetical protein ACJ73_08930 [Blastomyces percursus]|uniref:Uncharacterized protein n=1 Tax=Blastomyces percursus TaxID=1658174 RepID=A0A1J9QJ58_9EURO|nr:hypothetical protein ACJ73_08930 [Blastomyces percursus]
MRLRDRFADHAEPYRRLSEIHPRSRTEDLFDQPHRLRKNSQKPPRERSKGERIYEREPPAFPHESESRQIRNTSRFTNDKNLHNDDAWESGHSYPPVVPTNPTPAKVAFARGPPLDPAPVDFDQERPGRSYGFAPGPPDPSWAASNNTQTRSDKPNREREESRQRPTHLHRGQDYCYAAPTNNTNLHGRQLVQTSPREPKITISDPSPILLRLSSPGIYESPVSISRAASTEFSHSSSSSGEESAHLSRRTRERESSEDDTDSPRGKVNNDYGPGDDSEHDMN